MSTSKAQELDVFGHPVGFSHRLMHRGRIITKGTGLDYYRKFTNQAAFFNERGVKPVTKISNT